MSLFDKLKQLQEDNVRLTKENKELKEKIKNMKKAEKGFMYLMRKYVLSKIDKE